MELLDVTKHKMEKAVEKLDEKFKNDSHRSSKRIFVRTCTF